MAGIARTLSMAGVAKRSADDAIFRAQAREQANERFRQQQEQYGIDKEIRGLQLDEIRRSQQNLNRYREGLSEGKSFKELSQMAYDMGDMTSFGQFKAFAKEAETEGLDKVIRLAYKPGVTSEELTSVNNSQGNEKVDRIAVEEIKDADGNVVDLRLTAFQGGQPMRSFTRNQMAVALGVVPTGDYDIKEGVMFDKKTGKWTRMPTAAEDKYIKVKDEDDGVSDEGSTTTPQ